MEFGENRRHVIHVLTRSTGNFDFNSGGSLMGMGSNDWDDASQIDDDDVGDSLLPRQQARRPLLGYSCQELRVGLPSRVQRIVLSLRPAVSYVRFLKGLGRA